MSRFELFDPDRRDENRPAHQVLLALDIALLIAIYAYAMHNDAQGKTINEHHWGKPTTAQQQAFREEARDQLRLAQIGARP